MGSVPSLASGSNAPPKIWILEVQDRHTVGSPVVAHLLIERVEKLEKDNTGQIYRASIELYYQLIDESRDPPGGRFAGAFSQSSNMVSISAPCIDRGFITLDLPGLKNQRIGTYLQNEIIKWVMQWPDVPVFPIELRKEQAHKDRRNHFYDRFGLSFDFSDGEHQAGIAKPMLAGQLKPVESWAIENQLKNIVALPVDIFLAKALAAKESARRELFFREKACSDLIAERREVEASPVAWICKRLWWKFRVIVECNLPWLAVGSILALAWCWKK